MAVALTEKAVQQVKQLMQAQNLEDLYLHGTTLDYVMQGLTGGFTFVNPNAKSSCGCGTSFSA
jgi:predicted flavoprotein YhiN